MNVGLSADRTRCMVYTAAYGEAPLALVGRPGDLRGSDNPDLDGLRVVIEQDFLTGPQVRARFPRARQLVAHSSLAALEMVRDDKADVYIGNAYVATELIAVQHLQAASSRWPKRWTGPGPQPARPSAMPWRGAGCRHRNGRRRRRWR
ncbi:hypothetical protein G6F59_016219 [Rhizopus arrhizus]|nr:hypothetical protein G6F59_016219 [Rhizopus arrhizus]